MAEVRLKTNTGGERTFDDEALGEMEATFGAGFVMPGSEGYDEARELWNGMLDRSPGLAVRARGVADVVAGVDFARDHDIVLSVKGGGHGVAGTAVIDGSLLLDVSLMNSVRFDPDTGRVRVGGGATLGDVDRETQVFGRAVPAGVVSTTGVGGLASGGGTGWQMRKHGLTIDNLVSVDIVTADGQPRVANARENEDLYWGVRGGGGNLGIITSFEFETHPLGPNVYLHCPWYPAQRGAEVLERWRDFMSEAPEEFGAAFLWWWVPENPFFPAEHHGEAVLIPLVVYLGDPDEGQQLVEPLKVLGEPMIDLSGPIPWLAFQSMFDPFVPARGLRYYWKSIYLNRLDDEVIDHLMEVANTTPSKNTYHVILPLDGAVSRVDGEATAFGPRQAPYVFEFDSMWSDPSDDERNIEWTRDAWEKTRRFSDGGLYLNFPGFGENEEDIVRESLGAANYDKLVTLKNKYDPTNLFRNNLNVPPSGGTA